MDSSTDMTMSSFGGYQRSEPAQLCIGGCGFYGTAAKQGMCSKCYAAIFKDTTALIKCDVPSSEENQSKLDVGAVKELGDQSHDHPVVAKKDRCRQCSKKVRLLGFDCRCGDTFCGTHRYPHAHACGFDFKGAGKKEIQMKNPVIKSDKIIHRI